jgi:hypothetical protein
MRGLLYNIMDITFGERQFARSSRAGRRRERGVLTEINQLHAARAAVRSFPQPEDFFYSFQLVLFAS